MRTKIRIIRTGGYILLAAIVCIAAFGFIRGELQIFRPTAMANPQQSGTSEPVTDIPESAEAVLSEGAHGEYAKELANYIGFPYFQKDKIENYINYKSENKEYSYQTIVTYVNIGLDKSYYTDIKEITDPQSISTLVNKYWMIPNHYVPDGLEKISGTGYLLRHEARLAFENMRNDAKELGLSIFPVSSYRSYEYQKSIYDKRAAEKGQSHVDRTSARPGYSEHQLGLAVDVNGVENRLANTKTYTWYSQNAHKYGFIIRYPAGKEHITGYSYEPWHLRYLGEGLAAEVYKSGLTYDEYYIRFLRPGQAAYRVQ